MSIAPGQFEAINRRVALRAAICPDAPALVVQAETLSYGWLDQTARRWAGAIVDRLGRPARRVGVFGSRSAVSYAGALAASFSGGAFVPLNPRFPIERTATMAASADLDAIIIDQAGLRQLGPMLDLLEQSPILLVPEGDLGSAPKGNVVGPSDLSHRHPLEDIPETKPDDVAYLLFTSGSTGKPKGVPVTHGNLRAFLDWASDRYRVYPGDRFSQTFDQTFDLSVFDLFVAWESGATVYSPTSIELLSPVRFINSNELTVWFSVPSIPAQMRRRKTLQPDLFPTLRWSLFCGEPLPVASAEAWQQAAPNSIVENLYGPTELTIACFVHRWNPQSSPPRSVNGVVPIGLPFPGLREVLVNDELRPAGPVDPGELCVSGPQTVPGYWLDQARTRDRFVSIPEFPGETFYRTGDRVMPLPNGEYAFLGRTDFQVKVLGFRVELGEVEAALLRDPAVVEAVALGWPEAEGGSARGVRAFVSGAGVDVGRLERLARASLADYMMPSGIHFVEKLPLTSNGKVDRSALRSWLETECNRTPVGAGT